MRLNILIAKVSSITLTTCLITLLLALVTASKLMSPWMFYASYGMLCLLKIYGYIKRRGKGHLPFTLADCIAVGYALLFSLPTYYSQVITIGFVCLSMLMIEYHFRTKSDASNTTSRVGIKPFDTTGTTSVLDNSPPKTPKSDAYNTTSRVGIKPFDTTGTTSVLDNSPPRTPKTGASYTTPRAPDTIDDLFFKNTDTPAHDSSDGADPYADDTDDTGALAVDLTTRF